jgi:hypothetical protein
MYDLKKLDAADREFAAQDKKATAPKFLGIGAVTLLIALTLIVFFAHRAIGCTVAIVP